MSVESFTFGTVKTKYGKRGFLELQNCPKMEIDPTICNICDMFKETITKNTYEHGIKCAMVSDTKCGNSLCFNYDTESSNNCNRFGQTIECKVFQKLNQDSGGSK